MHLQLRTKLTGISPPFHVIGQVISLQHILTVQLLKANCMAHGVAMLRDRELKQCNWVPILVSLLCYIWTNTVGSTFSQYKWTQDNNPIIPKPIKTHPEEVQNFETLYPCLKDINHHRRIGKVKERSCLLPALKAKQHRNYVNQYSEVAEF